MTNDLLDFTHFVAFEKAAQAGNFTRAAEELGLSQPALSHRIRLLEDMLGRRLFVRRHKGVTLTDDGEALYEAVSASLTRIRYVVDRFRQENAKQRLRISLDFAFGTLWLMPRLTMNELALETIDLQINSAHLSPARHMRESDVAFVLADPADVPSHAVRLFPEAVVPVCSPAFLAEHPEAADITRLRDLPLNHNEQPKSGAWITWRDWGLANGLDWVPTGPQATFSTYQLVLQATMAGRGLALGWQGLIDDLLKSGQLVVPVQAPVQSSRWYYAVLSSVRPSPAATAFLTAIERLIDDS